MAGTSAQVVVEYAAALELVLGPEAMSRVSEAAGMAGKDAALDAAEASLGPDRAMSNFKRGKVSLGAGYDVLTPNSVAINHRPVGLWFLADEGRGPSTERVFPRNKKALMTPYGPRRSVSRGRGSRGLGTFKRAAARERVEVVRAADVALGAELVRFSSARR